MKTKKERKYFAGVMRRWPTEAESLLDQELQALNEEAKYSKNYAVLVYKRQELKCGYILDFYFPLRRLAVEIDGPSHKSREQYDRKRDKRLSTVGIETMRITNEEIISNPMETVNRVYKKARSRFRKTKRSKRPKGHGYNRVIIT